MLNKMINDENREINNNFVIRKVEMKDMEQICDLHKRCRQENFKWIIEQNHLDKFGRNPVSWWNFIDEKDPSSYSMFVYDKWWKVAGFIDWWKLNWFMTDEWEKNKNQYDFEIYGFYVDPEIQREWIGRKLFEYLLASENFKDKKKFYLRTLKDNNVWGNFYKKMWGKIIDEMKKKFGNKEYDLVCYARKK